MIGHCFCRGLLFFSFWFFTQSNGEDVRDVSELLNTCLDSQNHKHKPGPEDQLFQSCEPWKNHACCTLQTTINIHHTDMYNFTYNHCEASTGKKMSEECRRHFDQDMCFFECEPHIGPWKVKVNRKFAKERYFQVPLCASDCDSWFNACRFDYTCVSNWPRGMNFTKGVNRCPNNAKCLTFDEVYINAKNFCEQVWDFSWKYTSDTQSCMRLWFNGTKGNPNERATMLKIRDIKLINGASNYLLSPSILILPLVTLVRLL